jgi:hypothetical protein
MVSAWMIFAFLIALVSCLFVSQATSGVAGICFACFLAIAARVTQANDHHRELLRALADSAATRQTAPKPEGQARPLTLEEKAAAAGITSR